MSTTHHATGAGSDGVGHLSLADLGYDWSRVADPGIPARAPFQVYLPRHTQDVVRAVKQARANGEAVVVRGHARSSNNLVTPERGVVMLSDLMNQVLSVDSDAMTVTVQGGATLAVVDQVLAEAGLGLSIIGEHEYITAAGFASVGGISPASHRHGMFVDTVQAMEYVDWTGTVHRCSRTEHTDQLLRVLAGTGKHGVITELTIDVVRVDKLRTVLHNRSHLSPSLHDFVRYSGEMIRNPGDAVMERGVWADFDLPVLSGASLRMGQFSSYHPTRQRRYKSWWNDLGYGVQKQIGYWAARAPALLNDVTRYVGMGAVMLSPRYAGVKNIERFTDSILTATVSDPTRMFVVLAPAERYETLFHQLYETALAERRHSGAVTSIAIHVKSVRSPYLSGGDLNKRYCEIMLSVGVRPEKMTDQVLNQFVRQMDRLTVANGAYRCLYSLTSQDPVIRDQVDPNSRYRRPPVAAATAAESTPRPVPKPPPRPGPKPTARATAKPVPTAAEPARRAAAEPARRAAAATAGATRNSGTAGSGAGAKGTTARNGRSAAVPVPDTGKAAGRRRVPAAERAKR
ncbi:MAG TPA: FAD-dependent oxidoreductase [Micromonosporaceae bacterium]|nr:FAD-dependent oxidoreductase [Micromonosporaceae bacterium]